jgi:hypothetical protein
MIDADVSRMIELRDASERTDHIPGKFLFFIALNIDSAERRISPRTWSDSPEWRRGCGTAIKSAAQITGKYRRRKEFLLLHG